MAKTISSYIDKTDNPPLGIASCLRQKQSAINV